MKKTMLLFVSLIFLVGCNETPKEQQEATKEAVTEAPLAATPEKKKPLSPHTSAMAMVGDAHIHIDYSSPGVRERIIFGGLLPYDVVWQAGAHRATWIETNSDILISGKALKAGKYGFFVIPNKTEWTVIFNSNWDQHGKDDYDEKDDVLRFKVTPEISEEIQEHLIYTVEKTNDSSGTIKFAWEKVGIQFSFEIK
ncbi:MAG: hypothetical protein ACI828_002647 [Flavobacteriales bacterium]|jgi:hypothetical protein